MKSSQGISFPNFMHPVDGTPISTVKMLEDETSLESRAWTPHLAEILVVSRQGIDLYQTVLSRGVCIGVRRYVT
jgi:hypothetical protein